METLDVRNMILSCPLVEKPVSIPGWSANLLIRELSADHGSKLLAACTDSNGVVNQQALIAGIVIDTLRNADDPNKALVFGKVNADEGDPVYRDQLMSTGLGRIMAVATASIQLSGLDTSVSIDAAKND